MTGRSSDEASEGTPVSGGLPSEAPLDVSNSDSPCEHADAEEITVLTRESLRSLQRQHAKRVLHEAVDRLFLEPLETDRLTHARLVANDVARFWALAEVAIDPLVGRLMDDLPASCPEGGEHKWSVEGRQAREHFADLTADRYHKAAIAYLAILGGTQSTHTYPLSSGAIYR